LPARRLLQAGAPGSAPQGVPGVDRRRSHAAPQRIEFKRLY